MAPPHLCPKIKQQSYVYVTFDHIKSSTAISYLAVLARETEEEGSV